MAPKALAPGVRFHPTDVELVKYYLQKKVTGKRIRFDVISELDVYKFSPSELPDKSHLRSTDLEWFFFCPRERKYVNGARMNRSTENGYWKTTGRDRLINFNDKTVGMIKTLVYHEGRAPHGSRTDWVMHEYRLKDEELAKSGINQDSYVICKIFLKSGPGPRPTQHLFKEDDWSDDDDDDTSLNTCPSTDSPFLGAMNINPDNISTDASVEGNCLKSIKILEKGDSDNISVIVLPSSPKEFPSMVTVQKDVTACEVPQVSNSHICGTQSEYKSHLQCQNGTHGNCSLLCEGIPHSTIFLAGEMLGEGTSMLPSRSHGTAVGLSDSINHGGIIQFQSATPDSHGLYKDFGNFYDLGVQSGIDDSFIELDDLTNPLDNEFQWSHLIPSDGLLDEIKQQGSELPPPLSVDDYSGRLCYDAPAESQLLPETSVGFSSCSHTPQKVDADEIWNSLFLCNENWRYEEG